MQVMAAADLSEEQVEDGYLLYDIHRRLTARVRPTLWGALAPVRLSRS